MESKIEIITGIRPTGDLTVANYLGAVKPIIELQNQGCRPLVFVADLHALTDNDPSTVKRFTGEVVADYLALGVDPKKTRIFKQSAVEGEVTVLMTLLARHISAAELLRVPTLKEKIKSSARPETANALLLLYPVLMAADILLQRAKSVPVGKDQLAHIEVTKELARRFNKNYGNVFPVPAALLVKSLHILSLRGEGKMSKSLPSGAIFLTDDLKTVAQKIKTAETAFAGKMNERLKSHILIAENLCANEQDREKLKKIIKEHEQGQAVMERFKQVFTRIVQSFLREFQTKRARIIKNPSFVDSVIEDGAKIARENGRETLRLVKKAMFSEN